MSRHEQRRHRPTWAVALAAAAAGLGAGLGVPAALADQPPRPVVVPTVPRACTDALATADEVIATASAFGSMMMGLHAVDSGVHYFNKDGKHYQDSQRFTTTVAELSRTYEQAKTACRAETK